MSQTINHAMQYGSLCFLLGGVGGRHQSSCRSDVAIQVPRNCGSLESSGVVSTQTCILLQPIKRGYTHWLIQKIFSMVQHWRA